MPPGANEAFSRVLIDKALEFSGWNLLDPKEVRFEMAIGDQRADYVLGGQRGLRRGNRREATVSHQRPAHCDRAEQVKHSFLSHAATLRRATLREREGRIIFGECPISQRGASLAFVGGRREVGEIRSPKTEIRRKPEIRNPKT